MNAFFNYWIPRFNHQILIHIKVFTKKKKEEEGKFQTFAISSNFLKQKEGTENFGRKEMFKNVIFFSLFGRRTENERNDAPNNTSSLPPPRRRRHRHPVPWLVQSYALHLESPRTPGHTKILQGSNLNIGFNIFF